MGEAGFSAVGHSPPKKSKPERVVFQVRTHVIGISNVNSQIQEGEKLLIKRVRRKRDDPYEMAVYDASVGCHIGYMPAAIASSLAPFMERHPAIRIRGLVPDVPRAEHCSDLGPLDVTMDLILSGPEQLGSELRALTESLAVARKEPF